MFKTFKTNRLQLRPIELNDAGFMFKNWTQKLTVAKYMTWKPHNKIEQTEQFINACVEGWKNNDFTWIIEIKNTSEIIGSFAARQGGHKLDVGYLLLEKYWGKGFMTEVIAAFIQEAFKLEGIQRVGAVCDTQNIASKRVMEKAGMSYEGILKSWLIHPNINDKPRDCHCLSTIKGQFN